MADRRRRLSSEDRFIVGVVVFLVVVFGGATWFVVQQGERCEVRGGRWVNAGSATCVDDDGRVIDLG